MCNNRILEMADRFDRIYDAHWVNFYHFVHNQGLHNQDSTILDEYDMPCDVKEVMLAWGGQNAQRYLKEEAPNMGGATLEDLTKTALGIKALKSVLIEVNCH